MRMWTKAALAAGAAVVVLVGVVAVRTATYEAPVAVDRGIELAAAPAFDLQSAAAHLSQAIGFQTVSHQDAADNQAAEWDRLHAWLQATYPTAHAAMSRDIVAGHSLVYTWPGSDASLDPIVLMAHQDVVPADAAEGWTHPPFDGVIADGAVWGRGATRAR